MSKATAKLASIGVDEPNQAILYDCFKQFGIQVLPMNGEAAAAFGKQKFEGCVLRLYAPDAKEILTAARSSPSNQRMVIYGIARDTAEALKFSSFGINAVLDEPLDRQAVLRVVRSTQMLLIHELRRYVRIPVVTQASIELGNGKNLLAASVEVSAGGMSIRSGANIPIREAARLAFVLPGDKAVKVKAHVCWSRPNEHLYGLRFDASDSGRLAVRTWIDLYLQLV